MPPEAVPVDPTAPIVAPESAPCGSPIPVTWNLPSTITPAPSDWITLIPVGMQIGPAGYGDWRYTGGAQSGAAYIPASAVPGWYEIRFYQNYDNLRLRSSPLLVTNTPNPPVWTLGPSATADERLANARALQAVVDAGCGGSGRALLPDGDIYLDLTDETSIRIWNRLTLESAGHTELHVGPSQEAYGAARNLFRVEPGSFKVEILPGIEAFGPRYTPRIVQDGVTYSEGAGIPIAFLHSIGSALPGCERQIWIRDLKLAASISATPSGFDTGCYIEPDAAGSTTEFRLLDSRVDTLGQAVVAFGAGGETYVSRCWLKAGWLYGPLENGWGNVLYVHQGRPLYVDGCTITTRFGRDCIKYAGIRAEGRGRSARISDCVLRCDRVESLRAIGFTPREEDEHWGNGIGFDKFAECAISNNYFEASLGGAVQYWGKVTLTGGVVECPWVFGAGGDQTGEHPMITCIGVRMAGISYVMSSVLENAVWSFVGCPVETDKAVTLFATSQRPQRVYIRDCPIRIWNAAGEPFGEQLGTWEVTNSPVLRD